MINTIFYFPESLTFEDYVSKLASGDIASRTIVFADAQKAIYNRGKKYGGLSTSEFHDMVDSLYDDSWIIDEINGIKSDISDADARINGLNTLISGINTRLDGQVSSLDQNIKNKVEALFADVQWLRDNFTSGVVEWQQGWNDNIAAYLRTVGYWDIDGNGNEIYKWTKIQQSVDSISATVSRLTADGTIPAALQASIEALINGNIAQLNLGTSYAAITDVNNLKSVVEWLYSGLKSQSDPNSTFAEIFAAGKNSLTSSIANVRTYVDKLAGGDYVATSEVTAKVKDSLATLIARAASDNVLAALSAKADANSDDIAALLLGMTGSSSTADIQTRISNLMSGFLSTADLNTAKSEIYSAISAKDGNDNFISLAALKTAVDANTASISAIASNGADTSGLVTRAGLGEAVAELFASSGNGQSADAKASVVALVRDNKSSLQLSAQDIDIAGYLNAGSATFKGDIVANQFVTGGNQLSGISVMTGQFDSSIANTNKAYFAYDNAQGAVTMWFYKDNAWKRIDLSSTQVLSAEEGFIDHTVYNLNLDTMDLPTNPTPIHIYESRTSGKCFTTASSAGQLATGTYYKIKRYRTSVDNWYRAVAMDAETVNYPSVGGTNKNGPQSGVCIIPLIDGQAQAYGSYSSIPVDGRKASETLAAADITKFVVDSNGYIQESDGRVATAYYMVKDLISTAVGTGGTAGIVYDLDYMEPMKLQGIEYTYGALVSAVFVRPANLSKIVLVVTLNGTVFNCSGRSEWGTSAFIPCTLRKALTYTPGMPSDGGIIYTYDLSDESTELHAGQVGPVQYIDAGPDFNAGNIDEL